MEFRKMRTFWSLLKQNNLDPANAKPLLAILPCSRRECATTEIGMGLIYATMIVLWMILFPPAATSRQDLWPASEQHRPIGVESGQSLGFSRTLAQ
jgi:hypothetical protein